MTSLIVNVLLLLGISTQIIIAQTQPVCSCSSLETCTNQQFSKDQLQLAQCQDKSRSALGSDKVATAVLRCINEIAQQMHSESQQKNRCVWQQTNLCTGQFPATTSASAAQGIVQSRNKRHGFSGGGYRRGGGGGSGEFHGFDSKMPSELQTFQNQVNQCMRNSTQQQQPRFKRHHGGRGGGGSWKGGLGGGTANCAQQLNCTLNYTQGRDRAMMAASTRQQLQTCINSTNADRSSQYQSYCECIRNAFGRNATDMPCNATTFGNGGSELRFSQGGQRNSQKWQNHDKY